MSLDNTPHPSVKQCADKVNARYIHGRPGHELGRALIKRGAKGGLMPAARTPDNSPPVCRIEWQCVGNA